MLDLGLIGFAQPWILAALLTLPGLWWLLRLLPPPPRLERFPAIALLAGLIAREESAARMPLWLLILRLVLAALVILALAEPVLAPQQALRGKGPVVVMVDNGWAAAPRWPEAERALGNILDEAERADRPLAIVPTAAASVPLEPVSLAPASSWRATAGALAPQPWRPDLPAAEAALAEIAGSGETIWLSDGLEEPGRNALAQRLQRLGRLLVMQPPDDSLLLQEPTASAVGLTVSARRSGDDGPLTARVQAVAADGRLLAATDLDFGDGDAQASADWTLPRDVLNQVQALQIAGSEGAGGLVLLDDRWQRRLVGVIDAGAARAGHPLLDSNHYLRAALTDIAATRQGSLESLLAETPSLLIARDRLQPSAATVAALEPWLLGGGVLLRFAGPGLADEPDQWLPVRLRPVSRALGGALSWEDPQTLAPFPEDSPFAGLAISDEVTVNRQVLAEPSPDLRERTWASLADGTPLVTAARRGEGWIVLVHVSADANWSSLSLSGLFLEMLDRLVRLGHGQAAVGAGDQPLQPRLVLDGFARLQAPPPNVQALPAGVREAPVALGPAHPPGYYGGEASRFAWNLAPALAGEPLRQIEEWPSGVEVQGYSQQRSRDLGAWLLLAAVILLLADMVASLLLRGHLGRGSRAAAAGVVGLVLLPAILASPAAQASDELALQATLATRLAYVTTGDPEVDRASAAGLAGLSQVLAARTAVEPDPPLPVDIESSELAFFPLIYWPVLPTQPSLTAQGRERVSLFLERGGTILFDTRDQDTGGEVGPGGLRLRALLEGVRIPPLEPIPPDHVLTRAFYLLDRFPGRWEGAPVWVESDAATNRDGVTSVIIGRHDWAAAWAVGPDWRPLYPVYPGDRRQREFAYRFGVNLVMHVLTGNYKGDQVHIPDILERLGQ